MRLAGEARRRAARWRAAAPGLALLLTLSAASPSRVLADVVFLTDAGRQALGADASHKEGVIRGQRFRYLGTDGLAVDVEVGARPDRPVMGVVGLVLEWQPYALGWPEDTPRVMLLPSWVQRRIRHELDTLADLEDLRDRLRRREAGDLSAGGAEVPARLGREGLVTLARFDAFGEVPDPGLPEALRAALIEALAWGRAWDPGATADRAAATRASSGAEVRRAWCRTMTFDPERWSELDALEYEVDPRLAARAGLVLLEEVLEAFAGPAAAGSTLENLQRTVRYEAAAALWTLGALADAEAPSPTRAARAAALLDEARATARRLAAADPGLGEALRRTGMALARRADAWARRCLAPWAPTLGAVDPEAAEAVVLTALDRAEAAEGYAVVHALVAAYPPAAKTRSEYLARLREDEARMAARRDPPAHVLEELAELRARIAGIAGS